MLPPFDLNYTTIKAPLQQKTPQKNCDAKVKNHNKKFILLEM